MAKLKHMGKEYPKSYIFLERILIDAKERIKQLPIISRGQMMSFGAMCGLEDPQLISKAARFLTQNGVMLFFGNDPLLNNIIILDPQWLTNVMATLFTTRHRFVSHGILRHVDLAQIWKEYPPEIHSALLYLLTKFEIVFQLPPHTWSRVEYLVSSKPIPTNDRKVQVVSPRSKKSSISSSPPVMEKTKRARATSLALSPRKSRTSLRPIISRSSTDTKDGDKIQDTPLSSSPAGDSNIPIKFPSLPPLPNLPPIVTPTKSGSPGSAKKHSESARGRAMTTYSTAKSQFTPFNVPEDPADAPTETVVIPALTRTQSALQLRKPPPKMSLRGRSHSMPTAAKHAKRKAEMCERFLFK